jgi:hypothetical protein
MHAIVLAQVPDSLLNLVSFLLPFCYEQIWLNETQAGVSCHKLYHACFRSLEYIIWPFDASEKYLWQLEWFCKHCVLPCIWTFLIHSWNLTEAYVSCPSLSLNLYSCMRALGTSVILYLNSWRCTRRNIASCPFMTPL